MEAFMNLADLELFIQVADAGSLSAAARVLDCSPAVASAALKRLELQLGARLFSRSTRSLRLTREGTLFLAYARKALSLLQEGRGLLDGELHHVAGQLSISAPSDLGRHWLQPALNDFQALYPQVQLQLSLSDELRYGQLSDSGLIATRLLDNRRLLCAAPAYLQRAGMPQQLEALKQHNCLTFFLRGERYDHWHFRDGQGNQSDLTVNGNRSASDGALVREWVLAGLGIAYKSQLDIAADVQAGRLQVVLPDYWQDAPLYLVYAEREYLRPAVRCFIDFMKARVRS
jgi:DNA-binding transcriptional LysR family regulator